jgi:hypothetical protein
MARAGLRGNLASVGKLRADLKAFPLSLAHAVAQKSAPVLSTLTSDAYTGGRTVYGDARPAGKYGALDLKRSGRTLASMHFDATGNLVRAVLGTDYAKYLVGKYRVLPMGFIPVEWSRALDAIVHAEKFQP